jgi:uncharacterized membrane protein SpoIIM required for sporulation
VSGRRRLAVDELEELARLYRQTTGDLAVARRDFPDDGSTLYVNQLVARAHAVIYREAPSPLSRLKDFFLRDLPREYRSSWPYLLAAAALFFGPWLAAVVAILLSPGNAALMVPPVLLDRISGGETWFDIDGPKRSFVASFIMTHNMEVAFLAVAGGMLAGVGTAAALVYNGLELGAVTGALIAYGLGDRLLGFVSPHGFLELSAIVIAGGCGLMLGQAIVWAGLRPRREALVEAGGRAMRLLMGSQPFLVVAGLLEGFVSPAGFPWPFKLAIGLATAVGLYGYLLLAGRTDSRSKFKIQSQILNFEP